MWKKLEPLGIAGESVKWCSCCRKVWQFLKNLNIEYDPEIHFWVYAQNMKANRYLYTNVHSSIIHNSQKVETIQMSIYRWMDKQNVVLSIKWNFIQP